MTGITLGSTPITGVYLGSTPITGIYLGSTKLWPTASPVFSPASLFAAGEQGALYDSSDFSMMFQDSAGTTPVTAVGQPVGLIKDKSGNGNDASQATSTKRPLLSARLNLFGQTADLTLSPWAMSSGVTVTPGQLAPDGTYTAFKIYVPSGKFGFYQTWTNTVVFPATFHAGLMMRADTATNIELGVNGLSSAVNNKGAIATVGSSWSQITYSATTAGYDTGLYISIAGTNVNNAGALAGDRTVYVWHPQFGRNSIGKYQRVATPSDYDTVGFPRYSNFDGVDDALNTTFPNLGTNATVARSITGMGASILTAQTINAGNWSNSTDSCATIVINRALTGPETANLTTWLNAKAGV